jgi:hypothetical protein
MVKESNNGILLVSAFVCLFLGLALIVVIANQTNAVTDTTVVNNELLNINSAKYADGATNTSVGFSIANIVSATNTWRSEVDACNIATISEGTSNLIIRNSSGTRFTLNTDYKVSQTNGSITFQQTNAVNGTLSNNTYVSYHYCPDTYVSGWSGTMLDFVPGFFALALLGCSLALFYGVAKNTGLV